MRLLPHCKEGLGNYLSGIIGANYICQKAGMELELSSESKFFFKNTNILHKKSTAGT